jgi:hypothetical protein
LLQGARCHKYNSVTTDLNNEQRSFPSPNTGGGAHSNSMVITTQLSCSATNNSPPLTVQGHQSQLPAPNNTPALRNRRIPQISLRNKAADLFQVSLNAAFRHTKIPEM